MTEKNLYDIVQDTMRERNFLYRDELHKRFGKTNPFGMMSVSEDERLFVYENAEEEDIEYARQTYGDDALRQFSVEMEQLKARRKK